METKKRYFVVDSKTNKKIDYFYTKIEATSLKTKLLKKKYNEFLKNQEKNNGEFVEFWKWYCLENNGIYNAKLFKIIED